MTTKFKSDKKADYFLSEILRQRSKLNNSVLRREKYNLVKERKDTMIYPIYSPQKCQTTRFLHPYTNYSKVFPP